ncbi:MAG TPA: hypothetical protein P5024_12280 [Burkholderiaceae bacterium]|nr:hypothetical protein [Burkholderiaceae bacterium]
MAARDFATPAGLLTLAGAALAILAAAWLYQRRGSLTVEGVASDLAGAAVDTVTGAASGALSSVSDALGIARPADTVGDVDRARELIGQLGYFRASQLVDAVTFARAALAGPLYYGNEGRRQAPAPELTPGNWTG